MSFKIPCGGFRLDEKLFSLDKNDVLSIPKPLTYDYMPEGYPSKGIEYVTLMEEEEVTFSNKNGVFSAFTPYILDVKLGDKLTVVWDGVSYNVTVKTIGGEISGVFVFGNLGLIGLGDTEDYPFVCMMDGPQAQAQWGTNDTAASHTIKVMRQQVTITPMFTDFLPKNFNVVFSEVDGTTMPDSCNVTYDELRGWIENGTPVFAIYKTEDNGRVVDVTNITGFLANTDSLNVYYLSGSSQNYFEYKSDGTFSGGGPS